MLSWGSRVNLASAEFRPSTRSELGGKFSVAFAPREAKFGA